jgi:hypothetical protein
MSRSNPKTVAITAAFAAILVQTGAVGGSTWPLPTPLAPLASLTVDVCHLDKTSGVWKKVSVADPAVDSHMKNHDDALAGGVTSLSATQLDAECQPVQVNHLQCPCWSNYTQQQLAAALNAETVTQSECLSFNPGATRVRDDDDNVPSLLAENGTSYDCAMRTSDGFTGVITLTQAQANQCNAELTALIPLVSWCTAPSKPHVTAPKQ